MLKNESLKKSVDAVFDQIEEITPESIILSAKDRASCVNGRYPRKLMILGR